MVARASADLQHAHAWLDRQGVKHAGHHRWLRTGRGGLLFLIQARYQRPVAVDDRQPVRKLVCGRRRIGRLAHQPGERRALLLIVVRDKEVACHLCKRCAERRRGKNALVHQPLHILVLPGPGQLRGISQAVHPFHLSVPAPDFRRWSADHSFSRLPLPSPEEGSLRFPLPNRYQLLRFHPGSWSYWCRSSFSGRRSRFLASLSLVRQTAGRKARVPPRMPVRPTSHSERLLEPSKPSFPHALWYQRRSRHEICTQYFFRGKPPLVFSFQKSIVVATTGIKYNMVGITSQAQSSNLIENEEFMKGCGALPCQSAEKRLVRAFPTFRTGGKRSSSLRDQENIVQRENRTLNLEICQALLSSLSLYGIPVVATSVHRIRGKVYP